MDHNSPLEVLFLTPWYPSGENPAAGMFVKQHAKAASLSSNITVLVFSEVPITQKQIYSVSEVANSHMRTITIKIRSSPVPHTNTLFHLLGIWSCFRNLIKTGYRPDIIHANVYWAGAYAAVLSMLYNIPLIITEHTTDFCLRPLTTLEKLKAKFSMNRARMILPVSEDLKNHILKYGVKSEVRVIPNAVDTQLFYPLASRPDPHEKGPEKKMLLLAVLTPRKGIPRLFEALAQIREKREDFFLDIVGDGPNRIEYEKLAREFSLNHNVKFHGKQSDILGFMRDCDFFVLPSLYENFGVVYIEAMACGKPVIATCAGGPAELVNKEVGLLVPPKDIDSLRRAIEFMLDNYRNYIPEKIAQYARDRFSLQTVGNMLSEVYEHVARQEMTITK